MMNNIKELRLAFLLTPKQLADRLGIKVDVLRQLENSDLPLANEWNEAVALAFRVPTPTISDPDADIGAVVAAASSFHVPEYPICRVGARFAIQAMVAKLGGLNIALDLSEESLANAVQNLLAYAEEEKSAEVEPELRLNRLSQSLQIVALTILQSRGVDPDREFPQTMVIARDGALSLLRIYSQLEQVNANPESE
ncbi:MAG: helix-turn-helix transcriptional regulator [Alphaproteobacteria bacterium]|nr:helix-turn-helix transcriptional regulator [Alphaproteobacteria bacterium]